MFRGRFFRTRCSGLSTYMLYAVAVSRAKNYVAVGAMKAMEVTDNVT